MPSEYQEPSYRVGNVVERILYPAKASRNVILVLMSLYLSGSYLINAYSPSSLLTFLQTDWIVALFAVLLGGVLVVENSARLALYAQSNPDNPRIAVGIVLSFTALGCGLGLLRIWLPILIRFR